MSIPFQIICDSYTQVFYAFNVFQYSALKGVVTRPFISCICQLHHVAFDGLKSHSPFPSPCLNDQCLSEVSMYRSIGRQVSAR